MRTRWAVWSVWVRKAAGRWTVCGGLRACGSRAPDGLRRFGFGRGDLVPGVWRFGLFGSRIASHHPWPFWLKWAHRLASPVARRRWFRFGAVWGGLETAKACGRFGRFVLAFLGSLRPAGLGGLEFGGVRWRFGFAINATPAKRIGRFASRCRPWPVCPKSNCRPLCGQIWSILVDSGQFWSILVNSSLEM